MTPAAILLVCLLTPVLATPGLLEVRDNSFAKPFELSIWANSGEGHQAGDITIFQATTPYTSATAVQDGNDGKPRNSTSDDGIDIWRLGRVFFTAPTDKPRRVWINKNQLDGCPTQCDVHIPLDPGIERLAWLLERGLETFSAEGKVKADVPGQDKVKIVCHAIEEEQLPK